MKNPINKDLFEICQGFCFYNIKLKENNNQLVGIICLNILLTEINYSFLNINNFVFYIWDKLLIYLDSPSFYPKSYLLKYIYDFISKFKIPFKPFVNIAIYKILEFIDINDASIRKASLNILGLLISFYPNEIEPIKNSIMQLLVILHNDNDGNIRNKSIYIYNKIKTQYNSSHSINPIKRKNTIYISMILAMIIGLIKKLIIQLDLLIIYVIGDSCLEIKQVRAFFYTEIQSEEKLWTQNL